MLGRIWTTRCDLAYESAWDKWNECHDVVGYMNPGCDEALEYGEPSLAWICLRAVAFGR